MEKRGRDVLSKYTGWQRYTTNLKNRWFEKYAATQRQYINMAAGR